MPEARDTLFRHWLMLRRIPRHPRSISARDLAGYLTEEGYRVSNRTVERDLAKLSGIFGYTCEEDGRSNRWFWPPHAKLMDVPGMEPVTALAFNLANEHLSSLLPPSTLDLLAPYFRRSTEILDAADANQLAAWRDKVRVIQSGPRLQNPRVDFPIQTVVYQALLQEQRVAMRYTGRASDESRDYEFSPLGLVARHGVFYLVGPFWEYDNVVQIALHRIDSVRILDKRVYWPETFDLDEYVQSEGEFSYPTGAGRIRLVAVFEAGAAYHLYERPLSDDQQIKELEDGRVRVTASVLETDDLRWWLLGFGGNVEVRQPVELRRALIKEVEKMARTYQGR